MAISRVTINGFRQETGTTSRVTLDGFRQETVAAASGAQTLTATKFTNTSTFGAHTLTPGAVTLTPTKFTNTSTFGTQVLTNLNTLSATKFTNTSAFGSPAISVGAVTLTPTKFSNTSTFGTHVLTQVTNQTLTATKFSNVSTFGSHALSGGVQEAATGGGFLDYGENARINRRKQEIEASEEQQAEKTHDIDLVSVAPINKLAQKQQDRLDKAIALATQENSELRALNLERDDEIKSLLMAEQAIRNEDEEVLMLYAATLRQPMQIAA